MALPAEPDSVYDTSLIDKVGPVSSSFMVITPVPSAIVAFVGLDKFTFIVSSASSKLSPVTATSKVAVVEPAGIVIVPVPAV